MNGNFWKNMIGILAGAAVIIAIKKGQSRSGDRQDFVIDLQIRAVGRDAKNDDEEAANDEKNGCWRSGKGQIFDEDADNLVDCAEDFDGDTDWDEDHIPTYYDPGDAL